MQQISQKKLAMRPQPLYNASRSRCKAANRYIRRSGSSVWLERSPVTAEVAGSSPVRFVLHEKRHTFTVCLFSCNSAPDLPPPATSSSDPVSGCTDEAEASGGRLSPRPDRTPPGRFTPCASKGPGGGRGFFAPRQGVQPTLFLPRIAPPSQCVFFVTTRRVSHPQPRQVTMVHHAARMRLMKPV